ncbi:MAG: hypothetical protein KGQ59_00620 [Bdellovibrionales bacterium]|nr:hypothetical protein [Bdellovibrionales bacterium]
MNAAIPNHLKMGYEPRVSSKRFSLILFFFFLAQLPLGTQARAFPQSIGLGYGACQTCHYHPAGGGALSDYGRALAATIFSARPFYLKAENQSSEEIDETLAQHSGFLGREPLPGWLRPNLTYRGMHYSQNLGSSNSISRWITMQADMGVTIKSPKERLIAVGRFGYIPAPSNVSQSQKKAAQSWISREHYLGVRASKHLGMYLGMMDTVFGLKVPDHTAYLRSKTLFNQNDQSHGLLMHYSTTESDLYLHVLTGNLYQSSDLRQKGVSISGEHEFTKTLRLGASGFVGSNNYRDRHLAATHLRWGFPGNSALLAQLGVIREDFISSAPAVGGYWFGQFFTELSRGLNLMMTTEAYTSDWTVKKTRLFRAGPSIQYLPMQRLELRFDILGTHSRGDDLLSADTFTLQSQVHLWL